MKRHHLILALVGVIVLCGFLVRGSPEFFSAYRLWLKAATLAVAVLALVLLRPRSVARSKGERGDQPQQPRAENKPVLLALAALSILNLYHFGRFHGNNFVHYYDVVHSYLGSKYFSELGYNDLYLAFIGAEQEGANQFRRIQYVRDLESNQPVPIASVRSEVKRVKSSFSEARWRSFERDFRFFREQEPPRRWREILLDHGYNPSPIWTVTGSTLANLLDRAGLSTDRAVHVLAALDPLLLALLVLLIRWAFGFEVACCSVVFLANNPLVPLEFTGGGFLRQDWLLSLVGALCLYQRGWHLLAGVFLSYAVGTRLFPATFALIPLLHFATRWLRSREIAWPELRFGLGLAASLLALFTISLPATGGLSTWVTFVENTRAHDRGVHSNHVAFRNAFLYQSGKALRDCGNDSQRWIGDKQRRLSGLRVPYYLAAAALTALLLFLFRNSSTLDGLCVSGFIPFLLFYPAGYYYNFLLPVLFLAFKEGRWLVLGFFGLELVGSVGATFIPRLDEHSAFMSAVIAVLGLGILGLQIAKARRRPATILTD